jgi:fatty-acyl-CoA synthase
VKRAPFWPVHVDPAPPAPRTTLPQCLAAAAARHPHKTAIVFGDQITRYADLLARSDALAGYLQQRLGVAPGDRVLLISQNSPHWVEACYAIWRAGAVVVPVNPMCKAAEVAYHAADSGARVVVLTDDLLVQLTLSDEAGAGQAAVVMGARAAVAAGSANGPPSGGASKSDSPPSMRHQHAFEPAIALGLKPGLIPTDPDALALLPYTSGTTGKPKGCRHSHATLLASIAASAVWKQLHNDSVVLTVAPLFHMLGLQNGMNLPLFLGATAVMMQRWHADTAARLMEQHHVTAWSAPPAMVMDLFNDAGTAQRDLSSLALLSGGGAAMPQAVAAMLFERFGLVYQEAYGLTETASFLHANPPLHCKRQCLGLPTQGVDSRIVNPETGTELPPGQVGELVTRAPQVMLGYWHNEEADRTSFISLQGQRFFRTGDLAVVDEDGYFFLKDRLKRMINVSGYKVWPAEVESALYAHPAVLEACVIAVPDARHPAGACSGLVGEAVKALVVLKPNWPEPVSAESFIAWCREQMAVYKAPKLVEFVAALPKASTGKVAWRELQEAHAAAASEHPHDRPKASQVAQTAAIDRARGA